MQTRRRHRGGGSFAWLLAGLLACAQAVAGSPPDASPTLRAVIGEYRSASHSLTLFEDGGRLFAFLSTVAPDSSGGSVIALHSTGLNAYTAEDGQRLRIVKDRNSSQASGLEWSGTLFERYDLGTERVASIRAHVRTDPQSLRAEALASQPPAEPVAKLRAFDLVPLLGSVPFVKLDVKYATPDNFIGLPLYSVAAAYLQRPAAEALAAVARSLAQQGLGLVIFDGYRPWFVTKMFWDAVPPEAHVFVADPSEGSKHNRGCAVDLSLYDLKTGRPIEMTGRYDEMSPRSYADYRGGTSRERWFRDLLRQEMQARGFQVYPEEWWHFDYQDWQQYPLGNQAFENLSMATRE